MVKLQPILLQRISWSVVVKVSNVLYDLSQNALLPL